MKNQLLVTRHPHPSPEAVGSPGPAATSPASLGLTDLPGVPLACQWNPTSHLWSFVATAHFGSICVVEGVGTLAFYCEWCAAVNTRPLPLRVKPVALASGRSCVCAEPRGPSLCLVP